MTQPASWLGEAPANWSVKRLKYVSSINDEALPETTDPEYELLYVDIGSVDATAGIQKKEPIIFENAPSRARRIVRDGDTIVSTVRTYLCAVASIEQAEENLVVSTGFAVVRPKGAAPKFLAYCLRSSYFIETVVSRSVGVSYPATNPTDVSCIEVPLPPLEEQQSIARFLDAKTVQIDMLVEKKRQLIDKLKEKRSALIARTVTRGLPPDAAKAAGFAPNPEMQDSGVNWIGDIPSSWKIERLRRVCRRVTDGAHISPDLSSDDFPFVSTVDIANGNVDMKNCLRTSVECYEYLVRTGCKPFSGDVLFSKDGTVGRTAVIDFTADFVVASSLVIISPDSRHLNFRFLDYWLNNSLLQQEVTLQMAGAALRRISVEKIGRLPVLLPPPNEQQAIVLYLDGEMKQLDELVTKTEAAIDRLTEYRQTLITSAVTGKINVRNFQDDQ